MNIACIYIHIYIYILFTYIYLQRPSKPVCYTKPTPVASPPKHRGRIIPAGDWRCRWRSPWRSWSWQRNCNFQWYFRPPAGEAGVIKLIKIGGIKRYKSMVRQPCICLVSSRCHFVHENLWRIRPWCIRGMSRTDGSTLRCLRKMMQNGWGLTRRKALGWKSEVETWRRCERGSCDMIWVECYWKLCIFHMFFKLYRCYNW